MGGLSKPGDLGSLAKFDCRLISRDVQIDAFKNRRDFYADFNEKTIRAHLT